MLPIEAIDRLFQRFAGVYMGAWDRAVGNAPINDVKSAWLAELAEFGRSRESMLRIVWALDNLPDNPPSAPAFKRLCRQAPAAEAPKLEQQPANKERVAAELAKLGHLRKGPSPRSIDGRDWARRIIARHEDGERILPYTLKCARDALARRFIAEEATA